MHVVFVNYVYDHDLKSPDALLDRYGTLTGWAEGVAAAGARVSVVQRFGQDTEVVRCGIRYHFVVDPIRRAGSLFDRAPRIHRVVTRLAPDVVHINGLFLARQAWHLKRRLPHTPLLLQDHKDAAPSRRLTRPLWRIALRCADAVSFAAQDMAQPWREAGLLRPETPVFELMEGSSRYRLQPRAAARARTGLTGDPICLWLARLNANKDPMTILRGFAGALPQLPQARLVMVYRTEDLLPTVRAWLAENPSVASRVELLGCVPDSEIEALFNSADFYLLGSHFEGSGFAVLEALSCGVIPVLSDIPPFRVLTGSGEFGGLWPVGDAEALARALIAEYSQLNPDSPQRVRAYFDANWSFEAIGQRAYAAYAGLLKAKR